MHQSDAVDALYAALALAHKKFPVITKDKWNPHFQSHYADLANIREAIKPALNENDLFIIQTWTANGPAVTVTTRICHKSGQWIEDIFCAEARNGSAQAVGAAVTYICRYALIEMLGLSVSDDDDDGNSTQGQQQGPKQDLIANPGDVFDVNTMDKELAAELKKRNVPEAKWEAIGKWLHGKNKKRLSEAIASV